MQRPGCFCPCSGTQGNWDDSGFSHDNVELSKPPLQHMLGEVSTVPSIMSRLSHPLPLSSHLDVALFPAEKNSFPGARCVQCSGDGAGSGC